VNGSTAYQEYKARSVLKNILSAFNKELALSVAFASSACRQLSITEVYADGSLITRE
jgi:hypothetical protein